MRRFAIVDLSNKINSIVEAIDIRPISFVIIYGDTDMYAGLRCAKALIVGIATKIPGLRHLIHGYWQTFRDLETASAHNDALIASVLLVQSWCVDAAKKYDVVAAVHPSDFMFQYNLRTRRDDVQGAVNQYFERGNAAVELLRSSLACRVNPAARPLRLLEFASGYGCVSRHLAKYSDEFELVACDIHDEGRKFYANQLNLPFIRSASRPDDFAAPTDFDVVYALSFFTHMPRATWTAWLTTLFQRVAPGGYLIFTTHGTGYLKIWAPRQVPADGFFFMPVSEQQDIDLTEYGTTATSPAFVKAEISKLPKARLAQFREKEWMRRQDLYIVQKEGADA